MQKRMHIHTQDHTSRRVDIHMHVHTHTHALWHDVWVWYTIGSSFHNPSGRHGSQNGQNGSQQSDDAQLPTIINHHEPLLYRTMTS